MIVLPLRFINYKLISLDVHNGTRKSLAIPFATCQVSDVVGAVPERDENTEAVRNVEKATDSEPVHGEELLESEELKKKLAEAKKSAKSNAEKSR